MNRTLADHGRGDVVFWREGLTVAASGTTTSGVRAKAVVPLSGLEVSFAGIGGVRIVVLIASAWA